MEAQPHEVTILLERVRAGDRDAENRLYEIVMPQLRRMAQGLVNRERPNHTLRGTELVNRVYIRLAGAELSLRDRAHFFAIAGRAMRRELIDYARSRPKATFVPIDPGFEPPGSDGAPSLDVMLTVDELLDDLHDSQPVQCSIVELKYFFGMTNEETAEVLGLAPRTMEAKWQDARIWLFERAEAQQWRPKKPISRAATATS